MAEAAAFRAALLLVSEYTTLPMARRTPSEKDVAPLYIILNVRQKLCLSDTFRCFSSPNNRSQSTVCTPPTIVRAIYLSTWGPMDNPFRIAIGFVSPVPASAGSWIASLERAYARFTAPINSWRKSG